ncbi:EEF1D [Acanthosepion pharaonis]|uniref:EEF1D n=1 Tax=Acanthosepion pharaonis TaxID=158019 RepID=A0A812AKY6_ACAPH|nr:EEF1D [Sepia pharaonis]
MLCHTVLFPFHVVAVVLRSNLKMTSPLVYDTVWLQQPRFEEAESVFQNYLIHGKVSDHVPNADTGNAQIGNALEQRIHRLEQENQELKQTVEELRKMISSLNTQLKTSKNVKENEIMEVDNEPEEKQQADDDDDINLFDDDDDDEEAEKMREERLKAYAEKKAKKPAVIAKSSVTLDIKPWDDETDMKKIEECVRSIEMDGLLWGASKLVPLAFGIKKLSIICVIEDDKVSLDDLEEKIVAFEDHVQSMDIAAFQKI